MGCDYLKYYAISMLTALLEKKKRKILARWIQKGIMWAVDCGFMKGTRGGWHAFTILILVHLTYHSSTNFEINLGENRIQMISYKKMFKYPHERNWK